MPVSRFAPGISHDSSPHSFHQPKGKGGPSRAALMGWSLSRALDQEADQQAECSDGERNQNAPEQRRRVVLFSPPFDGKRA